MAMIPIPTPNRLEALALFRHAIVGDLVVSDLPRGALQDELKHRAKRHYRPPGAEATRTYHWKTLQRWLFAARKGLTELAPASRARGFALALDDDARELLLEIRREHPSASAEVILDAAIHEGAVAPGAISLQTLRRLYSRFDLARRGPDRQGRAKERRRWQTDRVCRVWHTDVCHVWRKNPDGSVEKAYVHAILDDHSRYVVAMRAMVAETENDLLELLVEALLRYPAPDVLYTDNGATYRGDLLTLALGKLGMRVVHAQPYDPEARGKMERFWRTLRQRLLDHDRSPRTLDELNVALLAWLDVDYHRRRHGGLLGGVPGQVFRKGLATLPSPRSLEDLAAVLQVQRTAKVRNDSTFSVDGLLYEVSGRHLARKTVTIHLDPFTREVISVRDGETAVRFNRCDPSANAHRGRAAELPPEAPRTDRFQRISRLLAAARGVTDAA